MMKEIKQGLDKAINAIKIEVTPGEQEQLAGELNDFLRWLEPLLAVDTADIEKVLNRQGFVNILREDKAQCGELDELHKAASNFEEGFYQVPPIIE